MALDNFIAAPHIGSATAQTTLKMGLMAAENALAVLRGERPAGVVNPEVYDWNRRMTCQEMLTALGQIGLVPVVKIDRAADAVPLGQALVAGGLPCAEITFRTAAAEEAIRAISPRRCPRCCWARAPCSPSNRRRRP